ncbi:hypothetical protein D3C71_2161640 [compost metagenome]
MIRNDRHIEVFVIMLLHILHGFFHLFMINVERLHASNILAQPAQQTFYAAKILVKMGKVRNILSLIE